MDISGKTDTMADEEKIKKALEHRRCVTNRGRSTQIHIWVRSRGQFTLDLASATS